MFKDRIENNRLWQKVSFITLVSKKISLMTISEMKGSLDIYNSTGLVNWYDRNIHTL